MDCPSCGLTTDAGLARLVSQAQADAAAAWLERDEARSEVARLRAAIETHQAEPCYGYQADARLYAVLEST